MEEEEVLKLAQKSLSLERRIPEQTNYDVFRKQVSNSVLQLFEMSKSSWSKRSWKKGVNLAVQIQAMFNVSAKLQSPRHVQLLKKYDGGSPRLASVIDVRCPKYVPSRNKELRCHLACRDDGICFSSSGNSKAVTYCNQRLFRSRRDSQGSRTHHQYAIKTWEWYPHSRQSWPMSEILFNYLPRTRSQGVLSTYHLQIRQ